MENVQNKYSTLKYCTSSPKPYKIELILSSQMWNHEVLAYSYWDFGETCHPHLQSGFLQNIGNHTLNYVVSCAKTHNFRFSNFSIVAEPNIANLTFGLPCWPSGIHTIFPPYIYQTFIFNATHLLPKTLRQYKFWISI